MADRTTLVTMVVSARNPVTTVMVAVLVFVGHTCITNSSSNVYGGARPNTHNHFNRDYMYNNRVNGYHQYTTRPYE